MKYAHAWWNGRRQFGMSVQLSRRWKINVGRWPHKPRGGFGIHGNKQYDYRSVSERECDRCDRSLELRGWSSSVHEWFYCPTCRYRLRTTDQMSATATDHMADLGMNEAEYKAHCASMVLTKSAAEIAAIQDRVRSDPKLWKRLGLDDEED